MKKDIHPDYVKTKVVCNGCGTNWETHSTVDKIEVEICSACHPFFTGKQKLVDVAGRVDKFRARQEAAKGRRTNKSSDSKKSSQAKSSTSAAKGEHSAATAASAKTAGKKASAKAKSKKSASKDKQ